MDEGSHRGAPPGKPEAQRRADRIRAFREELRAVEDIGLLSLPEDQRRALFSHHDSLLIDLARRFDVDISETQKQMSWGMRIASFLGALALCATLYFLFYRIWGFLTTPLQVCLLVTAPILAVLATELAACKERSLYFASLAGLVALACFILNLQVLGQIFNITPTQNALLPWSAFAIILAYTYGLRILLAGGILCFLAYLSATTGTWGGMYWLSFGERPENFIPAGLAVFTIPFLAPHRSRPEFPSMYRLIGLLAVLLPVLVLANWGEISYLLIEARTVEAMYQVTGFTLSAAAIWAGIRSRWAGVTNLGSTFFVVFLYTKFYDWWWDWMPKYLFFLVMALIAIGLLLLLKRLRSLTQPSLS